LISYEIVSTDTSLLRSSRRQSRVKAGEPGYRAEVFQRVLKACTLQEGDYVKVRGTPKKGQILKKHLEMDAIQWNNNRPLLLEVLIDGALHAAHPSQLKRILKP
jgi:hypothetical protein